jgi:hypothetical protein
MQDCMAGRLNQGTKEPKQTVIAVIFITSGLRWIGNDTAAASLGKATFLRLAADLNCSASIQIALSNRPTM